MSKISAEVEEALLDFIKEYDEDYDHADEYSHGSWNAWEEYEAVAKKQIWNKAFPDDVEPEYDWGSKEGNWEKWWDKYRAFFKDWEAPLYVNVPELGQVRVIENFGGEGKGDQYWMVFEVVSGTRTRYYKISGWYASFDGGYYDGPLVEVNPVQKYVTFYE